jgi:1,4-alpha-glucan branching enzyme
MPYVEGFGTYPFGEEWLFDAVARSHLPVLEVADRLTMTVTPVLADQLETDGVGERMLEFLRRHRLEPARLEGSESEVERYRRSIERLEELGGRAQDAFAEAAEAGRVELIASAATHAVLPKLASREGRRLQIDAGLRSHERRFGPTAGFWLPECAYEPGLESLLAERGIAYTCLDQSGHEPDGAALSPTALGGLVGFTIDWPTIELVWSHRGYPADPVYQEHHRLSDQGMRLWSISGERYDSGAAAARATEHAVAFLEAVRARLDGDRSDGLCVFAIDTELLGHWWTEGAIWLGEVVSRAESHGVRLVKLTQALAEHPAEERTALRSSWGEDKSLETWDSPVVFDLVWAARRMELRLLQSMGEGALGKAAAIRAARELLAVQSSDWAFMDHRGQAGDYPYRRVTGHAEAFQEVLHSSEAAEPRLRNLAPDLVLAPLLET